MYLTKSLEVLFVLANTKPLARICVNHKLVKKIQDFCHRHRLVCEVSDFKIIHMPTVDKGVSNKGMKVDVHSKIDGDVFVYLGKDQTKIQQLKQADAKDDHILVGKLLGYPDCCITFFASSYHDEIQKENDYIIPALQQTTTSHSFYNNVIMRYFDIGVLSHFPCSFNCEASKDLAKQNLSVLKTYAPQLAEHVTTLLKCPVVFTEQDGAHVLQGWRQNNITGKIEFESVLSTIKNNISYLLEQTKTIDQDNPHLICFQ